MSLNILLSNKFQFCERIINQRQNKRKKELGDVAWYLAEAATALEIPLETIFQTNLDKLEKRFPQGFASRDSIHRRKEDI